MRISIVAGLFACGHPADPPPAHPFTPVPIADAGPPAPIATGVCEPFDPRNPACLGDPRACGQDGVDCICPTPPDIRIPKCWAVMPCPSVPDLRVRACALPPWPPCPDPDHADDTNPNCPPSELMSRTIEFQALTGDEASITIGIGSDAGVTTTWKATLLRGESDDDLPGGEIEITGVTKSLTVGKVRAKRATVNANPRVRLRR